MICLLNCFFPALPFGTFSLATDHSAGVAESGTQLLIWLLVVGGADAVLCGGLCFCHRWHHRYHHHSHAALFRGLCDAQGLDRGARRLLAQIGRAHRLAQPACLFTEPRWLDPANLASRFTGRSKEIAALRTRLFSMAAPKAS